MCNCMTEIESKIKDKFSDKYTSITSVCFTNKAIIFERAKTVTVLAQPVNIHYLKENKAKTGTKERVEVVNMTPSYCPFCGEPYKAGGTS